jgi:hypothetical protein
VTKDLGGGTRYLGLSWTVRAVVEDRLNLYLWTRRLSNSGPGQGTTRPSYLDTDTYCTGVFTQPWAAYLIHMRSSSDGCKSTNRCEDL